MRKTILTTAFVALLFAFQGYAQEKPKQQKKEKAKAECNVGGKKCCSGEAKKGCGTDDASSKKTASTAASTDTKTTKS